MKLLLRSRKFWLLVFAIVQTVVSAYFKVDPEIWKAIDALVVFLIASIAYEDGQSKANGNFPPPVQ